MVDKGSRTIEGSAFKTQIGFKTRKLIQHPIYEFERALHRISFKHKASITRGKTSGRNDRVYSSQNYKTLTQRQLPDIN